MVDRNFTTARRGGFTGNDAFTGSMEITYFRAEWLLFSQHLLYTLQERFYRLTRSVILRVIIIKEKKQKKKHQAERTKLIHYNSIT